MVFFWYAYRYASLAFDTENLEVGSEFQLLAQNLSKFDLSKKILEFELEGDYKFFLTIIQDLATVTSVKGVSQYAVDNLSIILKADGASLYLLRDLDGDEAFVSKKFDLNLSKIVNNRSVLSKLMIDNDSSLDNEGKSWNMKICEHVASTGDTINLQIPIEVS